MVGGCDMDGSDEGAGEGLLKGTWRSSILMVVGIESSDCVDGVDGVVGWLAMSVGVFIVCAKYESKASWSIPLG